MWILFVHNLTNFNKKKIENNSSKIIASNSESDNIKEITNEALQSMLEESDEICLTQHSIQKELAKANQLAQYYQDCQFQNELIGIVNANIQIILQRGQALICKEKFLK